VSLAAKTSLSFCLEPGIYYTEEELGENFVNFPDKINDLIAKTPGIIAFFSDKYINKEGKELDINKITVYNPIR
jgi:phosphate transport system permease protein